jgi:VanZ family protein
MISYGFLMELLQGFVPGRDPSGLDMIANSSGILVGLVIFLLFKKQIIALYTKIHVL